MGFLGKALSGIMTTLLWPIEQLVGNTLYGIFMKGPLITLNILDNTFNYLAGSKVEGLLFGTSRMLSAIGFGTVIFIIPVCFITILFLFSSFLSIIIGVNLVVGKTNIKVFDEFTLVQIQGSTSSTETKASLSKIIENFKYTLIERGI